MINEWLLNQDFLTRALIAGLGIALMAGPLGSLMVWRRMAYFGDTLAHSTLLGVSLALLLNIHLYIGLIGICLIISCLLASLSRQKRLANDAILGILSHSTLALGLIIATSLEGIRVDLLGYLFGDILAVTGNDILWVIGINIFVLLVLWRFWKWLLSITIQEELARVEGVPVETMRWVLVIVMALVFAIAMKLVGVLLITALLVIPASAARQISRTPEQMACTASFIGCISVATGLWVSVQWDWPTGPAIVIAAASLFACFLLAGRILKLN